MKSEMVLPRNIRQIGEVQQDKKVYLEDYVMTFIQKKARKNPEGWAGILMGKKEQDEQGTYVFIKGALLLEESLEEMERWEKLEAERARFFPELDMAGYFVLGTLEEEKLKEIAERLPGPPLVIYHLQEEEDTVYWSEEKQYQRLKGYFVFYERNPQMQKYMAEFSEPEKVEGEEEVPDKAIASFREKIKEKAVRKHQGGTRYLAGSFAVLTFLMLGVTIIRNYDKMKEMEKVLATMSRSDTTQGVNAQGLVADSQEGSQPEAEAAIEGSQRLGEIQTEMGTETKAETGNETGTKTDTGAKAGAETGTQGEAVVLDLRKREEESQENSVQTGGGWEQQLSSQGAAQEASAQAAGDPVQEASAQTAGDLAQEVSTQIAGDLAQEASAQTGGDLAQEVSTQTAGDLAKEASAQAAGDPVQEASAQAAGDLAKEASAQAAGDPTQQVLQAGGQELLQESGASITSRSLAERNYSAESPDTVLQEEPGRVDEVLASVGSRQSQASYTIQYGDTLADISQKYYGTLDKVEDICIMNNIDNANHIVPGQKIVLP